MLVSILIPCYNAERWVAQAIESALAQTWPEKEIIVVDDGSEDGSLDVIRSFGQRISWETGPNCGGNAARNRLLELAQGAWIQYLDADDYLLANKIENQLDFVESMPEAEIVYSRVMADFGSGPEINLFPIDDMWVSLARWYAPQTGGYLWQRQTLRDVNGWNPTQPCCQENELILRLLMRGKKFTYYPGSGAVYRIWSDQTVCNRDAALVRQHRLEILRQAETFLRGSQQLSERRLWAINQGRFEMARLAWLEHRNLATEIIKTIRESQPDFMPGQPAAPFSYRLLYKIFGFRPAQHIADWRRAASVCINELIFSTQSNEQPLR